MAVVEVVVVAEPGFITHVYRDTGLGQRLLQQVRSFYPDAPITCIADGTDPAGMAAFCQDLNVTYAAGQRLKVWGKGGLWLERFLERGVAAGGDPIIKLDADSYLHRAFTTFPTADLAGKRSTKNWGVSFIRGGCLAIKASAASQILASGYLRDSLYNRADRYSYRCYEAYLLPGRLKEDTLIALTDPILGDIAQRLELSIADWDEVADGIQWRGLVPRNLDKQWAVTHPVMLLDRDTAIYQGLAVPGGTTAAALGWLYDRAEGQCVEVGSLYGRSAIAIGWKLNLTGGHLTCVDPWADYIDGQGQMVSAAAAYEQFVSNMNLVELPISWRREASPVVASQWQDGSLDLVFLDSAQGEAALMGELKSWQAKLKPNGLLCGRDYGYAEPFWKSSGFTIQRSGKLWYTRVFA